MRGFIRSKLSPYQRTKRNGAKYWVARGSVPIRLADGSFARKRTEHCLAGDTAVARQKEVDALNQGYEERALNPHLTFARAYLNYVAFHDVPNFAEQILKHLGERQCHEIDDSMMTEVKDAIFKPDAKASYVNRHLYTPVKAILNMALAENAPRLTRPAGHKKRPPIKIPAEEWFGSVLPHMTATTAALTLFFTMHGRRLGDALGRTPSDFSYEINHVEEDGKTIKKYSGTLIIDDTKTGEPVLIELHPTVVEAMLEMPNWQKRRWLFGDGPSSGSNVRRDILTACLKASGYDDQAANKIASEPSKYRDEIVGLEVPYFSPHKLGRHSFATRILRGGYSLKHLKDAGGWKTLEIVAETYGHLERAEVTASVHRVGDKFVGGLKPNAGGNAGVTSPKQSAQAIENNGETPCPKSR